MRVRDSWTDSSATKVFSSDFRLSDNSKQIIIIIIIIIINATSSQEIMVTRAPETYRFMLKYNSLGLFLALHLHANYSHCTQKHRRAQNEVSVLSSDLLS